MHRSHPRLKADGSDDKDVLHGLGVNQKAIRYALREDMAVFARLTAEGLSSVCASDFVASALDGEYVEVLQPYFDTDPVIDPSATDAVSEAARDMRRLQFAMGGAIALTADASFPGSPTSMLGNAELAAALSDACGVDVTASSTLADAFAALRERGGFKGPLHADAAMARTDADARSATGAVAERGTKRSFAGEKGSAAAGGATAEPEDEDAGFGRRAKPKKK